MVLLPGGEAYSAGGRRIRPGILNADGTIDRRRLAAEVFDRPERLEKSEGLVHPPVRARTRAIIDAFRAPPIPMESPSSRLRY